MGLSPFHPSNSLKSSNLFGFSFHITFKQKMGWPKFKKTIHISPSNFNQPPPPPALPLPKIETRGFSLNEKVSSTVFLIIIIFALIFFVFGLLHLLIRFLIRPPRRRDTDDEISYVTALEGQLQQLFHLHDEGIDQAFIDTFPVFNYKSIVGVTVNSPFDCAVCLSEFEPEDKLRLLPKCSHAFHMNCIDTWLLSHSTCPLCRATLFPDIVSNYYCSPVVLVLESGNESLRETGAVDRVNSHVSVRSDNEFRASLYDVSQRSCEIQLKEDEKVMQVKLGKYRNVDGEGCSENNVEQRRCFSMGSFAYMMDDNSTLKVQIRTPLKKISKKKPLSPGHRAAMSECGRDSRREFMAFRSIDESESEVITSNGSKESVLDDNNTIRGGKESFSISKIWLKGWKEKQNSAIGQSSRRAVSFRFPLQRYSVADGVGGGAAGGSGGGGGGRKTVSEIEVDKWENGGSELSYDVERQSSYSMDSQANSSFARKTLLWLMGNVSQNKVVHSSFSSNL